MTEFNGFGTTSPPGTSPPGSVLVYQSDPGAYTFGQTFTVDTPGLSAIKVRWYLPAGSPDGSGTGYEVALYEVGNPTALATAGPVSGAVGWNELDISPVALSVAPAEYRVAVLFPRGRYGAQSPSATPFDPAGPISFPSTGTYNSGSSLTYPTSTSGTSPWYGVDVTVSDGSSTPTVSIGGSTPAPGGALTAGGTPTVAAGGSTPAPGGALGVAPPGAAAVAGSTPAPGGHLSVYLPSAAGPTQASTDLAGWFTQNVTIERFLGSTGHGPTYAAPATVAAFVDQGAKLVRNPQGDQVVSSTRVFLPSTTDAVPLGSRVTLPAAYGGTRASVLGVALHLAPGLPVPEHLEVQLT